MFIIMLPPICNHSQGILLLLTIGMLPLVILFTTDEAAHRKLAEKAYSGFNLRAGSIYPVPYRVADLYHGCKVHMKRLSSHVLF